MLVATSVAARGLDIPKVLMMVNYYVHRIGRTGRCGNTGTSIAFISEKNRNVLRELHDMMKEAKQETEPWFDNLVKDYLSRCHHAWSPTLPGRRSVLHPPWSPPSPSPSPSPSPMVL